MENNKEILELLKQIDKSNRRQTLLCAGLCVFALIAAICCFVTFVTVGQLLPQITGMIPLITEALPQINEVITQMHTVLGNLEQTSEQLALVDLGSMVSDVNMLVTTGQQSLEQTMQKLNSIDIAALNQAIKDLAAVIEPLAKVSALFK